MRNVSHIPPTSAAAPTFLGKPSRSRRLPGSIGRALGKKAIGRGALHVWADRFDKAGTDPWALQDELTGKIVGAMTGEFGAIRKADYSQAWGKDSTNLAEYDYYLRAESQLNLYTKEGLERSGEISRQGLKVFPGSSLLTVELGWSHWLKVGLLYSSDPQKDLQEAERLVTQVLADKNLSPQVTRLANWLNAWLLTLKRDHAFQFSHHLEHFVDALRCRVHDDCAAPRSDLDKPDRAQLHQGFADRGAGYAEAHGAFR